MDALFGGIVMGESVRWHEGHVWFCDWGAGEVIRVDDGSPVVVTRVADGLPFCIDWTPSGALLLLDGPRARLLADGAVRADLSGIDGSHPWNDIVVDARGNAFVNNIGYDFPGGAPSTGLIAVVRPDGEASLAADGLHFPNGMAVLGSTLVVAESHAARLTAFDIANDGSLNNRREWASLPGGAPDGLCAAADGSVWYADVPNRHCRQVREGGEVVRTVELPDGAFDCALSGDGKTLYAVTADYTNPAAMFTGRTGRMFAVPL